MKRLTTYRASLALCAVVTTIGLGSLAMAQGSAPSNSAAPSTRAAPSIAAAAPSIAAAAPSATNGATAPESQESDQGDAPAHGRGGVLRQVPADRIEASPDVPPSTVEVTTLDPRSTPLGGVRVELVRDRQSVAEGNTSTKWQATTDAAGRASFAGIPSGSDSQYRVVVVEDGKRYGTRPFPMESRLGTKVAFHVYPLVRDLKKSLVAGRGFVFVEPRDDVLSIEYMQQFHNLGPSVLVADGLEITLPKGWKAFAANATDPDLTVEKTGNGAKLVGVVAPGQHSVAFTFQVPSSNRERIDFDLDLWPNTAEAQVATLARPGLELAVAGFPNASVTPGNGRVPFLATGQSFTHDSGPPRGLSIEIGGLPVVGPGRWVAVLAGAALALGAMAMVFRQGNSRSVTDQSAARACIVDELAALELAHQQGKIGDATYAETKEALLAAFVRIERENLST